MFAPSRMSEMVLTFNSKQHIKSLDGLRGVAILLVFLFHYLPRDRFNPLSVVASLGWSGVDLFFVLSGFLITGILYDTRHSAKFFRVFYSRRALRLLPAYCLAIVVVIAGTGFLRGSRTWIDIPFFIYGANVVMAISHARTFPPYFDCTHFWSLAVEEQFYSIWPIVVFLVASRRTLVGICVGGIAAAFVLRVILATFGASLWMIFTELPTRMDSLLAGALLAILLRGPSAEELLKPARWWWMLLASCLMLLPVVAAARSLFNLTTPMETAGLTVFAGISTCILGLALIPGSLVSRAGANPVLRFFGRYSYGLYIWHYLLNPVCNQWLPTFRRVLRFRIAADMVYTLTLLALFTGIAVLSYYLVEIHFLRMKPRLAAPPEVRVPATVEG